MPNRSPPPAVVIIVRHGARLDAANKQWHLTSPTPYDPPLTYGGWTQSRALGARIASLLQAREASPEDELEEMGSESGADGDEGGSANSNGHHQRHHTKNRGRKRKHKIMIHTSPFLRCVQTSVAISAGMAQYAGAIQSRPSVSQLHSRTHRTASLDSPTLEPIPEPEEDSPVPDSKPKGVNKATVRIDAFLGEWLSPDYFEKITPPPNSVMMVAGAKADLLRHAEPIAGSNSPSPNSPGNFPGGWGASLPARPAAAPEVVPTPSGSRDAPLSSPRKRDRASSYSSSGSSPGKPTPPTTSYISTNVPSDFTGYNPPTPTWAISPSDSIPRGYVAHAREACVKVDYQWDSMRPPQDWGNGGEYGEEWSAMHKRFRKGLHHMINWYKTQDHVSSDAVDGSDEEYTDTVLILVTHGAGCNALIGALTNQPVLLDVGMASLTMAVRKDIIYGSAALPDVEELSLKEDSRTSSRTRAPQIEVSDCYDVKLVASTEHLRAGSNPLIVPQIHAVPRLSTPRYRSDSHINTVDRPTINDVGRAATIGTGGLRRGSLASAIQPKSAYPGSAMRGLTGLWAAPSVSTTGEDEPSPGDDMVLNFGYSSNDPAPVEKAKLADERARAAERKARKGSGAEGSPSPGPGLNRTNSQRGLWGDAGAAVHPAIERERKLTLKRRWTVNEKQV